MGQLSTATLHHMWSGLCDRSAAAVRCGSEGGQEGGTPHSPRRALALSPETSHRCPLAGGMSDPPTPASVSAFFSARWCPRTPAFTPASVSIFFSACWCSQTPAFTPASVSAYSLLAGAPENLPLRLWLGPLCKTTCTAAYRSLSLSAPPLSCPPSLGGPPQGPLG